MEPCSPHGGRRLSSALPSPGGLGLPLFISRLCAAALAYCAERIFHSLGPPEACSPSESTSVVGGPPRPAPPIAHSMYRLPANWLSLRSLAGTWRAVSACRGVDRQQYRLKVLLPRKQFPLRGWGCWVSSVGESYECTLKNTSYAAHVTKYCIGSTSV